MQSSHNHLNICKYQIVSRSLTCSLLAILFSTLIAAEAVSGKDHPSTSATPVDDAPGPTVAYVNRGAARQMYGSGSLHGAHPAVPPPAPRHHHPPPPQPPPALPVVPVELPIHPSMKPIQIVYPLPGQVIQANAPINPASPRSGIRIAGGGIFNPGVGWPGGYVRGGIYIPHGGYMRPVLGRRYWLPHRGPPAADGTRHMKSEDLDDEETYDGPCGGECSGGQYLCAESCVCIDMEMRCNNEMDCENEEDELGCGEDEVGGRMQTECDDENSEFVRCPRSGKCIAKVWLCDGDDDCGDFSDETHCGSFSVNCTEDQFECMNGLCVQKSWLCDNDNDCKDNSDEINCTKTECKSHEFQCSDGTCISLSWKCDQEADCGDGTDELDCEPDPPSCSDREFQCSYSSYRRCIRTEFRCDGDNDCGDWSDEDGCSEKLGNCGTGEFKCNDDKCIPETWRCDRQQDCVSGEDEMHCTNVTHRTCSPEEYACSTGTCILKTWVCDGVPDCSGSEDETKCEVTCDENQFTCSGDDGTHNETAIPAFCVNRKHICDGRHDCPHGEDEKDCPKRLKCPTDTKCQQQCIETPDGKHACSCSTGYNLAADGYSCVDIDECLFEIEPVCSQECNNTIGSFVCSCTSGYVLRPDLRTCKALGAPPTLLFANRVDIRQVSLSNSKYISILKGLHNAIALDYHYKEGTVYWSDVSKDVIRRAFLNGTNTTDIIKWGLESPGGVAVDWVHNLIFWTDSGTKRVDVASLDGKHRYVIAANDLDKPRAIAVHPGEATVFWTDWGPNPKIEKADMDGSNRKSLVTESIFWPNGLTLDYTANKMYWADAKHHVIECANYDGSERRKVISKGLPHPFALTLFEDTIYWTDWHTKSISSANKVTGTSFRVVHSGLHFPMDIHSYHPQRQPTYRNHCGDNNGGCSHLCLPNRRSYTCVCPMGHRVHPDGRTCQAPDKLLLFARKKDLRIRQFEKQATSIDMVIPLEGIKSAVALAWDSDTDSIFWTDVEKDTINRAHINGTDQKAIVTTNLISPAGLALDWVTNKLYWTDAGTNRIEVANADGTMRTLLIWDGLDKPRDIVVDPAGGYMYWSDWGEIPKIEKAGMDGSSRSILISKNLTWPNGLAIDHMLGYIYWADGGTKAIEYSKLDGTGRKVLIGSNLAHPFGLDVFGSKVYWTDWETTSIQSANKLTGENVTVLGLDIVGLMDVRIFHRNRQQIKTACNQNNGGCSHLCLISPKGHSCACPLGIKLGEDGKSCANGPVNYLIFAHRVDIRQISLDVEYTVDVVLPLPPLKTAIAVDVDRKTGDIYWTDTAEDVIQKADPAGTAVETVIFDALESPDGIVIDSTGRKMYWTDAGRDSIEVAELDGTNRKVLIWSDLDSPRAITLHYHHGLMYWSDWGATPRIEQAWMDGTNRKILISKGLVWPIGLAIDRPAGRLYWNDASQKTIESSDLSGQDRRVILNNVRHPYGLVVVGSHIYWTDWQTESIHRADKLNGSDKTTIRDKLDGLMDIRSVQVENIAENACGINNGGCSHLCLRNPTSYTCVCPTGIVHEPGNDKKCKAQPDTYLLFATRSTLARVSLDTPELWDVTLSISNISNAIAVDFHWTKQIIYFTDVHLHVIRSVNMHNFSDTKTVISTNLTTPDGIAVDWIANNLYWTDTGRKVLEVSKLDGSCRKVLIKDGLDEPRAVALFPKKGYLYWSDWSDHSPKIERSMLDGSSRKTIVDSDLGFPNGISIDYNAKRLYWSDALRDRIETSDLNGHNRIHLVPDATHPFGLAQFGEHIYWTDWYKKSIVRADKKFGKNKVEIRRDLDGVMEIKAVSSDRQTGWNPCAVNNGGCSHLCLYRQSNYVCECPDDLDGKSCSKEPSSVVPNKKSDDDDKEEEYEDPDVLIPIHNNSFSDSDFNNVHTKAEDISTTIIVAIILVLVIIVIAILTVMAVMVYNTQKSKKKYMYAVGSVRTFSNPNYCTSTSSENNINSVQVADNKKPFLWKRIKYDKSQERVYEDKSTANSPEVASLIPVVLTPSSITPERRYSPPQSPTHRTDSIPLQTIG